MKAFIENHADNQYSDIIIQNTERFNDEDIFKHIEKHLKDKGLFKKKLLGPSEDVVIIQLNSEEISIIYDIDYGLDYIKCKSENAVELCNIINNILTKL